MKIEYVVGYSPKAFGGNGKYTVSKVTLENGKPMDIVQLRQFKTQHEAQAYADSLNTEETK